MVNALEDAQAFKSSGLLDRVDTPQAKARKEKILHNLKECVRIRVGMHTR